MASQKTSNDQIGFLGAVAIGVGGMVGGGIFAVLGLAAVLAGGATPVAFVVGGLVALLTAYSYARLSVAYPDNGGTIIFIDKAFRIDWFTGSSNMLLWLGYMVTLSLYAVAFGNYAATFLPKDWQTSLTSHLLISLGILIPTALNLLSAEAVSRIETYVVGLKVAILVLVVAVGFGGIDRQRLDPGGWPSLLSVVGAGMIIFVAYEGFELIANTAASVKDAAKTLPRAYFVTVLFVIVLYVLIALVVVGSLTPDAISQAEDFALAQAAKPSLGQVGFTLVAITAVLATFSAINSTLYGSARLSYSIATEGELPKHFEQKVWNQPVGLLVTAGAALALSNLADLSSISMMASASFLIIFALVNLANYRLREEAKSNRWIALGGVVLCVAALVALIGHVAGESPAKLWVLVALLGLSAGLEGLYILFLKEEGRIGRIRGN